MSDLGYDPCDRNSFPYQADDPPFGPHRLVLSEITIDRAPDLDAIQTLADMLDYDDDGPPNYRMLDMALRTFLNIANDPAYEGIDLPTIFAACSYQAMVWERG